MNFEDPVSAYPDLLSEHPDDRYSGIRALWLRVIVRALFDWVSYKDHTKLRERRYADSAYNWLFKPSHLFNSLDNVCFFLGVDPEAIRNRAKEMTKVDVVKIEHIEREYSSVLISKSAIELPILGRQGRYLRLPEYLISDFEERVENGAC